MTRWLLAFLVTQLCETPVYRCAGVRWRVAFLASAFTHPIVWFVFPQLRRVGIGYWAMVMLAELFAVGTEALWLWMSGMHGVHGVQRAIGWSLLANAVSVTVGLSLRARYGWP